MTQVVETVQDQRSSIWTPLLAGLFILATLGPLFLRLPLTNDAVLYDLESRWLQAGILPYRDVVEANFPGVLVIHSLTRSLGGPSNEALRVTDLIIVAAMLLSAFSLLRSAVVARQSVAWAVVLCLLFYLSQSEWGHCQRDTWLLLPAIVGCLLRWRQVCRLGHSQGSQTFLHSLGEGLVWGTGIWLKPHLIVMCVVVWGCSLLMPRGRLTKIIDASGLLLGGVIMGAVGLVGLLQLGALESFLISLREWNPGYLEARTANWTLQRYIAMNLWLAPWTLLHLLAIPISIRALFLFIFKPTVRDAQSFMRSMLVSIYLVWLFQAHFLQHLFDYVHLPAIFLAIFVLAAHVSDYTFLRARPVVAAFALVAVLMSPLVKQSQLQLIPDAIQGDLSPDQTDQLARLPNPDWTDLHTVERYLADQNVSDRDVLMFNSDLVTLYWRLQLQSPTPYVYFYELQQYFPQRKEQLLTAMRNGPQRFIVTDLVSCGMPVRLAEEVGEAGPNAPPPAYVRANLKSLPWTEPVVFRAGRYLVHEVQ